MTFPLPKFSGFLGLVCFPIFASQEKRGIGRDLRARKNEYTFKEQREGWERTREFLKILESVNKEGDAGFLAVNVIHLFPLKF